MGLILERQDINKTSAYTNTHTHIHTQERTKQVLAGALFGLNMLDVSSVTGLANKRAQLTLWMLTGALAATSAWTQAV